MAVDGALGSVGGKKIPYICFSAAVLLLLMGTSGDAGDGLWSAWTTSLAADTILLAAEVAGILTWVGENMTVSVIFLVWVS